MMVVFQWTQGVGEQLVIVGGVGCLQQMLNFTCLQQMFGKLLLLLGKHVFVVRENGNVLNVSVE
jgi:hypothetical protein